MKMLPATPASAPAEKAGHQWSLDGLRGVASICVVLAHFCGIFYPSTVFGPTYAVNSPTESWFYTTPLILLIHGELAVCIFFVMSGYVLTFRDVSNPTASRLRIAINIIKRPLRLGGLVLAVVLLSFVLKRFDLYKMHEVSALTGSSRYTAELLDFSSQVLPLVKNVIIRLFSASPAYSPPLWSIRDELWGSWVVFGILFLTRMPLGRWLLCAALLIVFQGSHIQGMIIGMLLGAFTKTRLFKEGLGHPLIAGSLLALALLMCSYPYYLREFSPDRFASTYFGGLPSLSYLAGSWCMIGAVLIVTLLLRWSASLPKSLRSLCVWLGNLSFSLYAVHFIVIASLTAQIYLYLRQSLGMDHHQSALAALTLSIPVLLGLAWLLWRWVDVSFIRLSQMVSQWLSDRYHRLVRPTPALVSDT